MSKENIDEGGPAFPTPEQGEIARQFPGMSLRDYFAGQAAAAIAGLATTVEGARNLKNFSKEKAVEPAEVIAAFSYEISDALIKQRSAPRE